MLDTATIVRALVGSISEDRLRGLVVALIMDELFPSTSVSGPRRRGRGRPPEAAKLVQNDDIGEVSNRDGRRAVNGRRRRKQPDDAKLLARRQRYAAKRKAKRRAARVVAAGGGEAAAANGQGGGGVEVSAQSLWRHAEKIEPQAPWRAVVRELGVKDIHAQAAYRKLSLPPQVGPMAVEKFLALPAGS
jgi:hypothetical protein